MPQPSIAAQLSLLEGAGLVQAAAVQPEALNRFGHAIMQATACNSLVKGDRQP